MSPLCVPNEESANADAPQAPPVGESRVMKACSSARRLWWVGFLLDSVSRKHNMGISAQGSRLRLGVFFVLCLVVVSVLGPAGPAIQSVRAQPPEGEAADQAKDKDKKDEAPRSA